MRFKKRLLTVFCLLMALGLAACASTGEIAMKKERAQAAQELGEAYMRQEAYTKALREFLKAEKIYAKDAYLQNDLGLAYMAKNRHDKAIEHFKYALELDSEFSPARNNLGAAYMENEEWDKAIETFKAVKDDLLYATPHYPLANLGFIYYHQGDYRKALSYYKEALILMPDFPRALHGRGRVYLKQGRYDKALIALEKAARKASNNPRILMDLGTAYRHVHEYNKAYKTFKKAASLAAEGSQLEEEAERQAEAVWRFH